MIAIVNGPNLNLLGLREPEIYGKETFESYLRHLRHSFPEIPIEYFQSNSEGEIIDKLHKFGYESPGCEGVIINPGAYAHYSLAIADAIRSIPLPVVEVHISNIHSREEFRHKSVTGAACRGIITGLGMKGYEMALRFLSEK